MFLMYYTVKTRCRLRQSVFIKLCVNTKLSKHGARQFICVMILAFIVSVGGSTRGFLLLVWRLLVLGALCLFLLFRFKQGLGFHFHSYGKIFCNQWIRIILSSKCDLYDTSAKIKRSIYFIINYNYLNIPSD